MSDKKPLTTEKRVELYQKNSQKWLDKLELEMIHGIDFPNRKRLPFLSRFAIAIITSQGGQVVTRFTHLKK